MYQEPTPPPSAPLRLASVTHTNCGDAYLLRASMFDVLSDDELRILWRSLGKSDLGTLCCTSRFFASHASAMFAHITCVDFEQRFRKLGDSGLTALADACAKGVLARLERLHLKQNQIGDVGLTALADACARGALAKLTNLDLFGNKIGDGGLIGLAEACANGALAKCTSIKLGCNPASVHAKRAVQNALKRRWLDGEFLATHLNEVTCLTMSYMKWGDMEMNKLAAALEYCHARGALANLTKLNLGSNQIGDVGFTAFAEACAKGALARLETLHLQVDHHIGDVGLTAFAKACAKGALPRCNDICMGGWLNYEAKKYLARALKNRWLDGDFLVRNLSDVQSLHCGGLGWGDVEMIKLASAIEYACARGGLKNLNDVYLFGNEIGDVGCAALAKGMGGLASLERLFIHNPSSQLEEYCKSNDIKLNSVF